MPLKNGTPEIIREVGSIPTKGTINQKLFIMKNMKEENPYDIEWVYKYDKVTGGTIWIKNNIWYAKLFSTDDMILKLELFLN